MPFMSQVQVPNLTLIPQSGTPGPAPVGTLLLFISAADNALYTVDSAGAVTTVSSQIWAPISNDNPASPLVQNSAGGFVLTRRQ